MSSTGKMLTIVLILSILLNIVLGYKYEKIKHAYSPDYSFNRKELFQHLKIDSGSVVFIGNSLTAQFELAELFNSSNMRNRGVNGERSDGLLIRLPVIIQGHPKKIFIEIGINDIGQAFPSTTILDNYMKILAKLQQESKTSKLYVQSVLPVYNSGPAITSSSMNNDTIRLVNKNLEVYCRAHDITYINLFDKFESGGQMNPGYCIADGLHISGEGYLLWAKLLKPYVEE